MAKSLTEEGKLKLCRLYKGEEECPLKLGSLEYFFWWDEYYWVNRSDDFYKSRRKTYEKLGGKQFPDIPYGLVIELFRSWSKWGVLYATKENLSGFYKNTVERYRNLFAK